MSISVIYKMYYALLVHCIQGGQAKVLQKLTPKQCYRQKNFNRETCNKSQRTKKSLNVVFTM